CRRRADVVTRGPLNALDDLARVVEPPEAPESRIVRKHSRRVQVNGPVRLDIADMGVGAKAFGRSPAVSARHRHEYRIDAPEPALDVGRYGVEHVRTLLGGRAVHETDNQLVGCRGASRSYRPETGYREREGDQKDGLKATRAPSSDRLFHSSSS